MSEAGGGNAELTHCPRCGDDDLVGPYDPEGFTVLCRTCGRCWRLDPGGPVRVDPAECSGCLQAARCRLLFSSGW